ncbi:quercetin 2,3-dioxygenase anaerobically complexed with the substrate kaempferol [Microthyrium microscopicum]|uniref:Quercetin 2,3-dioxygenase anaerobically complexed with the substrate kaempferol n=1 Tax=Microthyrium microscopicum TaxID=703497 RepID=A0A6A6UTS1_9PEZI|nr:quercetin 2,3-dioxygenase anaerobically complexed with the substrate kaempferol [Microthyrium microscopicum]
MAIYTFLLVFATTCLAAPSAAESLVVTDTPDHVRPYVVPHLTGHVVGNNRFPITAASSGGSMTLLSTNAGRSEYLSVPPHSHKRGYENFFCSRGALQLWLATSNTDQQLRLLEPGDMGASPPGRIHAFQTMRPDTELFGVTFPGGLEKMFYAGGGNATFATSTPFDPAPFKFTPGAAAPPRTAPRPGGTTSSMQEVFDIYPVQGFTARTDVGNGSAPASPHWHVRNEPLPKDTSAPFYVANNFAPKFLNSENGYTIVSPINTSPRSAPYNFTLSYLTMSKPKDVAAVPWRTFEEHGAFRIQDGALSMTVDGYGDYVPMHYGDVAFIPKGTKYKIHALVPGTKTLYVAVNGNGLDALLMRTAKPWDSASWPAAFA